MKTTELYKEIKNTFPTLHKCFFAFCNEQFDKGRIEAGIAEDEKIYTYGSVSGFYGTREGIAQYISDRDAILSRISKECDPQEVYDYEFANYECSLIHNDAEAIDTIIRFFGVEVAKTVKRRCANIEL